MIIDGLEINSPEYWELRHQRDDWPRWSEWAMSLVFDTVPEGAYVAIVGCGQGMEAIKLLEHRPDIRKAVAFDVSKTAIKKAIACHLKTDIPLKKIQFECADLFSPNPYIPSGAFDYVISIQNFEHWNYGDQIQAIRKCWRILKDGGQMFFTGVGKSWDLNNMNYGDLEYNGKIVKAPNDFHYNNWSEEEVYDLFGRVDAECVTFYRRRGRDRVIALGRKSVPKE